ncbi:16S rRNA (cytidine(1402)-2'-O)-methyltransferase [Paracoccaceae bacterium GXU_MW_L88]
MEAALYLVATPIGTAADITLRALDIFRSADILAAEDTRNLRRLLDIHGVALEGRPLVSYHDHNGAKVRPRIMAALAEGKSVAYASDAGTPLVADPGFQLAREAIAEGHTVRSAPGASAVLAALTVAGLPTDRFCFAGFAPNKGAARRHFFEDFGAVPATLIFYESPKRLAAALGEMAEVFGPRSAAVCRELTKKFEEVRRGALTDLAAAYADEPAPKGEIVVVIGPPEGDAEVDLDQALRTALTTMSVKDAAAHVATATGVKKREVYARALEISREDEA